MEGQSRCMPAVILLVSLLAIHSTLAYTTFVPRRHLLAPASKPVAALGDDATPFAGSNIPSDLQSSLDCKPARTGSVPEPLVCIFKNLVLYKGGFHFLAPTKPTDAWALARVQPGGARISNTLQELGVAPDAPTTRVKLAPLITPAAYHSYMSVFGTTMPTVHAVLCKHFERCSYDAHNLPNMILANPEIVKESDAARPIRNDWTACLSDTPVMLRNASALAGKLLLLETAFMLFTPGCSSGADCHPWCERNQVSPPLIADMENRNYSAHPHKDDVYQPWRNYLGICLGFDVASHGPSNALNILVIDRDYWAGRHILNINEVLRSLRERYPVANVTAFYPERYSVTEQARVYNNAHVIVWVTGSSMTNMMFAPHGSVGLHMGLRAHPATPYEWSQQWVERTVPHNIELHHVRTPNPDRVILRSYMVYKNALYESLTDEEKLGVWEMKACPGKPGDEVNRVCEDVWIGRGGEYEMEFGFLWEQMDKFMPRLVAKVTASA